jgi:hypothetical protein
MKRISFISLCSLILLVPACGWFNNRRRCCQPAYTSAPAPACCPAQSSCAPAAGAYYEGQPAPAGEQAQYTEGAYDETGRPAAGAPSQMEPSAPAGREQVGADYDYDLEEDEQELRRLEGQKPAATAAEEEEGLEAGK